MAILLPMPAIPRRGRRNRSLRDTIRRQQLKVWWHARLQLRLEADMLQTNLSIRPRPLRQTSNGQAREQHQLHSSWLAQRYHRKAALRRRRLNLIPSATPRHAFPRRGSRRPLSTPHLLHHPVVMRPISHRRVPNGHRARTEPRSSPRPSMTRPLHPTTPTRPRHTRPRSTPQMNTTTPVPSSAHQLSTFRLPPASRRSNPQTNPHSRPIRATNRPQTHHTTLPPRRPLPYLLVPPRRSHRRGPGPCSPRRRRSRAAAYSTRGSLYRARPAQKRRRSTGRTSHRRRTGRVRRDRQTITAQAACTRHNGDDGSLHLLRTWV